MKAGSMQRGMHRRSCVGTDMHECVKRCQHGSSCARRFFINAKIIEIVVLECESLALFMISCLHSAFYRKAAAVVIKAKGNELFKGGENDQAILKYEKALRYLEAYPGLQGEDVVAARLACHLNSAAAHLKIGNNKQCVKVSNIRRLCVREG